MSLVKTKFASEVPDIVLTGYREGNPRQRAEHASALAISYVEQEKLRGEEMVRFIVNGIGDPDLRIHLVACYIAMHMSYRIETSDLLGKAFPGKVTQEGEPDEITGSTEEDAESPDDIDLNLDEEFPSLSDKDIPSISYLRSEVWPRLVESALSETNEERMFPVLWALCWSGSYIEPSTEQKLDLALKLFDIFYTSTSYETRRFAAWAFWVFPPLESSDEFKSRITDCYSDDLESLHSFLASALGGKTSSVGMTDTERAAFLVCMHLGLLDRAEIDIFLKRNDPDPADLRWQRVLKQIFPSRP